MTSAKGLHLKSYFAGSVEAALETGRRELGPDALLVDSRMAPPEAQHLGRYEVVLALTPHPPGQAPAPAPPKSPTGSIEEGLARLSLSQLVERVERLVSQANPDSQFSPAPSSSDALSALMAEDVDEELARDLIECAHRRAAARSVPEIGRVVRQAPFLGLRAIEEQLAEEIASRFSIDSTIGAEAGGSRVVALIGPPGAGKTTTLVKLAVVYGLTARKPVQLLSMDTFRIAASEQLRSYAAVLGVGFQAPATTLALAQAIEEHSGKNLILIDTPGYSSSAMEDSGDMARFLASHPEVDTHLVLPASMKPADLRRCIDAFERFGPAKLLFTKLDETNCYGPILSEAARTGRPVSFLAAGQAVPEDIEPADKSRIVDSILQGLATRASTAA